MKLIYNYVLSYAHLNKVLLWKICS